MALSPSGTKGALFAILEWTRKEGEVKAEGRLRIKALPILMPEDISFGSIAEDTDCSPEAVQGFRKAAGDVVGKDCPR